MSTPRKGRSARRWLATASAVVTIAVAGSVPVPPAGAADEPTDMVLVWNANAVNVISQPSASTGLGQGPPLSALNMAMVHGAIYDAVNAIDGGHEPYLPGLSAPSTASQAAAVAQAAHDVLYGLTPAADTAANNAVRNRIDGLLATSLAMIDDGPAKADGIEVGADAAAAMLAARVGDGRSDNEPWVVGDDPGEWRTVPPFSGNVLGQFATVRPLTLTSPDQFITAGPLDVTSKRYAEEFNEVKALGARFGSSRTEAQRLTAGFFTANPVVFYNTGLRAIATAEGLSTSEQARLFVKASMGSADALIGCFANKKRWNAWRPETAIHAAGSDGNPLTVADPDWVSLFVPPGYPDEPSGYNCYTGGFWQSVRYFFGTDKMAFSLTSPGVAANAGAGNPIGVEGSTKSFGRFTDVIDGTIEGRILNGFHFRSGDVQGAWLGKKVAQWVDQRHFAPVD